MNINVDNIKRRMLVKYPFFGSAVASLKLKEANGLGTIGTDGKTIYYDPKFLGESSENKQTFLFAHEVCHIAFNHILRSEGKDKRLWNIATDAVINHFLERDGLEIPPDGVSEKALQEEGFDIENILGYNAEQLYNKLLKKKQEQQPNQSRNGESDKNEQQSDGQQQNQDQTSDDKEQSNSQEQGGNDVSDGEQQGKNEEQSSSGENNGNDGGQDGKEKQNQDQDVGHDTHDFWDEAVKKHKQGGSNDKDQEEKEQSDIKDKTNNDKLKELQEKLSKMGEEEAFKKNDQTRKEQLEELINALSKESKGAGTGTNREVRRTNEIGTSKPLIDWRLWLREAISMDVDWSYQNAELEDGVVRPNLEAYPIPETEIVLDTSGSIHENLLKNFLRECKNVLQASRVKVGCFDTEFYGFSEIRTLDDIDNLEYLGGGGTDFNVAVNAFTKRVENKIIFTDGDAPMPRTAVNAIWVVFGGKKINPAGGKVIHITEEQLEKLYYENDQKDIGRRMR